MKALKLVSALAAVAVATPSLAAAKPTIVLVHGAWETAGIWGFVEAGLKKDGYKVRSVTLPGRTGNPMPLGKVTFDMYPRAVAAAIAKEKGPVVLVGHSFAGFVISAEAEAQPKRIKTLVYVAAYLPQDGQSLLGLANTDADSKAGPALVIDKTKGIAAVKYGARAELFGNGAPPQVGQAIAKGIVDEPLAPLVAPVHLTAARFGSIDKVYIHTAQDHVVSPSLQRRMVAATPVRLELSVNTGHTPFITDPSGLTKAIERAAQ